MSDAPPDDGPWMDCRGVDAAAVGPAGTIYDGTGARLAGPGPERASEILDAAPPSDPRGASRESARMNSRFVSYLRVSTDKQGRSGLGLEAQREAVRAYVAKAGGALVEEVVEVESGRKAKRPQLARALALCKLTGAVLIVAKLDRLARNARFLLSVHDGVGEGGVVFCDLPNLPPGPVGTFMVQQLAAVAQLEAGLISQRTKEALRAVRARAAAEGRELKRGGWQPGGYVPDPAAGLKERQARADAFAAQLMPVLRPLRDQGKSLRAIATELTSRDIRTRRGGPWSAAAVNAVLARETAVGR